MKECSGKRLITKETIELSKISSSNLNIKKTSGKLKNWKIDAQKFKDGIRTEENS